jgi:type IV secretory pathway VirB10-like protein
MEREEQENKRTPTAAITEEDNSREKGAMPEESMLPSTFQSLRTLLEKARRNQQGAPSRRELSRDKSKAFLLLAGATVALFLIFLGVFSSPKTRAPLPGETARGAPSLGRKQSPGQDKNDATKTVTPMLTADVREGDNGSGSQVTPQEVGGTSPRYNQFRQVTGNAAGALEKPPAGRPANSEGYALKNVDFSDPAVAQPASIPNPPRLPAGESDTELKKPSIVFVRAAQNTTPAFQGSPIDEGTLAAVLPAGTRLVARLEAPVSSAVPAPVIAVVEYNYERNGEIVLPAGSRVFGKLSHVSPSGFVGFQFDRVETPEGAVEKIDATSMNLKFGPIKGSVSGRNRGKNFLVRSVTGIGTVAAYVVGGQGTTGFNGPISENTLLRERLADNIGMAGQDEINTLTANQTIVVTVPGNTRFYVVVEKGSSGEVGRSVPRSTDANGPNLAGSKAPTLEELRQLIQLRSELNQMYSQTNLQPGASQQ